MKKSNNKEKGRVAKPLQEETWYEVWMVINNDSTVNGGQTYTVYLKGGEEFLNQTMVYRDADFRMKRELPLIYFFSNCNTGPASKPYGNGGLLYDDLYMTKGVELSTPD